jgi:hypothetical protein
MNNLFSEIKNRLLIVQSISFQDWCASIEIVFQVAPEFQHRCKFVFQNCKAIEIENYNSETTGSLTDVIGFSIGLSQYLEKAVLTTNDFEIAITYKSVKWEHIETESLLV